MKRICISLVVLLLGVAPAQGEPNIYLSHHSGASYTAEIIEKLEKVNSSVTWADTASKTLPADLEPVASRHDAAVPSGNFIAIFERLLTFFLRWWEGDVAQPPAETETVAATLVVFQVTPDDLPSVDLYVVNSPAGSRTPPGSILRPLNAGRNEATLDQEGVWQFQARYQDRVSDVVTLTLPAPPEERTITLHVPPPPNKEP